MSEVREEFVAYERLLPSLLRDHSGQFVVLKGQRPVHFESDYEQALAWAFEHSENGCVFVKHVVPDGAQTHFTREVGLCQTAI
jgi:hypothetical protein